MPKKKKQTEIHIYEDVDLSDSEVPPLLRPNDADRKRPYSAKLR